MEPWYTGIGMLLFLFATPYFWAKPELLGEGFVELKRDMTPLYFAVVLLGMIVVTYVWVFFLILTGLYFIYKRFL